jgi:hypothetical protein
MWKVSIALNYGSGERLPEGLHPGFWAVGSHETMLANSMMHEAA